MTAARALSTTPSVLNGSEKVFEYPCTPCAREGIAKDAINFCTECSEYFCLECTKQHMKFGITATHDVLDKTKADQGGRKTSPGQLPTERCREHNGELMTSFCVDHDVVVCNSCATMDHRTCDSMTYIPKISGKSKARQDVLRTKAEVSTALKATKEARAIVQTHKNIVDDAKVKQMTMIKYHTKRLMDHFREMVKSAIANVISHHMESSNIIMANLASLDESDRILQKRLFSLDNAATNNDSQVFVDTKLGIREAEAAIKLERHLKSSGNEPVTATFVVDEGVDVILDDVSALGKVVVCKPFRAILKDTYDIKKKGDEDVSCVSDSCELPDGSILLTDYFNSCLKVLNKSYKIVTRFKMISRPWGICQTSPNMIAVALTRLKKIQFVDITSWKLTTSFKVADKCRGVAYSNEEIFVSCGGHPGSSTCDPEGPSCVAVYDRSGLLRRKIQVDDLGRQLFSVPYHIVTSHNGNKIHISDRTNGVITVDRQGVVLSSFCESLKWAHGLCSIGNGYVIVCGNKSNNILQITTDGELVAELLNVQDGINEPFCVVYSARKSILIVTFQYSNKLKVYNLHT